MKIVFRGWQREVHPHTHEVQPVTFEGRGYSPKGVGRPIEWRTSLNALGKIEGLSLSGAFLVDFTFKEEELKNWLKRYIHEKPEAGIKLLAEMQAEAILSLNRAKSSS